MAGAPRSGRGSGAGALTPAERRTLAAYAESGDYQAVADLLGLSLFTIRNQLSTAYRALGVTSAIDAFRVLGWLVPEREG